MDTIRKYEHVPHLAAWKPWSRLLLNKLFKNKKNHRLLLSQANVAGFGQSSVCSIEDAAFEEQSCHNGVTKVV